VGDKGDRKGADMQEAEAVVVGIDVAPASWDVAVRPSGEQRRLDNDATGIAAAVAASHGPARDRGRGHRRL
jgi:hypothetical protein